MFKLLLLLLLPGMAVAIESAQPAEVRAALVIGNADYKNGALRNPVNDARAVAASLEKVGFKVLLRENVNREGMHQSIAEFGKLLKAGGVGMFYYAGHGMQIKGRNFLIPVDADIQSEDDVEFRGMDANLVLSRMDGAHDRVNLLVLDACRNNPFGRNTRSASIGLAQMDAPKGTLIAFSTAPGSLAKDGAGANSIYTRYLVEKLALPAVPVEQVFKEVRIAVTRDTQDKQIPWESSSLMGDFYFVPPNPATPPILAAQAAIPNAEKIDKHTQAASAVPVAASVPAKKQQQNKHDFNREGYEIELRAKNLTIDEVPAMQAAAEGGDVVAQTTLGWAYLLGKGQMDGRGIVRSNTKMLSWTRAAAKQGYPVAQNNLGAIYMDGTGVKLDYNKAYEYFKLSAAQGYLTAKGNLLQASMILGKSDGGMVKDIFESMQKQLSEPVK